MARPWIHEGIQLEASGPEMPASVLRLGVWIIAALMQRDPTVRQGFLWLSVAKATAFWFTFAAFLVTQKWMLMLGLGAVTFLAGPLWHLWIARIMIVGCGEGNRGE
jgi:hypothetical protein